MRSRAELRKLYEDLIGKKIGKIFIKCKSKEKKYGQVSFDCICECGKEKLISYGNLTNGNMVSCGCWKSSKERMIPTFLNKIEKTESCWNWKGLINKQGYGRHNHQYAHRLSYEYHVGEIPKELMINHKCNNKICVHPDHLYAGTAKENARDAINDGVLKKRSLTSKRYIKKNIAS